MSQFSSLLFHIFPDYLLGAFGAFPPLFRGGFVCGCLSSRLLFGLLSSLLLVAAGIDVAIRPKEPAFRKYEEVEAFSWLNDEVEPNSVVLATFRTGNAIPAWAPVRVVIGHGPESVNLAELEVQVDAFYGEKMSETERLQFIRSHDVKYVWYGPREKALGLWSPNGSDFLTFVYGYADYKIYRVQSSQE